MALVLSTVVEIHGRVIDMAAPRVGDDGSRPRAAERAPATGPSAHDVMPDIVEEWGRQSFPASDPPANW
jgi:hypothetical protein